MTGAGIKEASDIWESALDWMGTPASILGLYQCQRFPVSRSCQRFETLPFENGQQFWCHAHQSMPGDLDGGQPIASLTGFPTLLSISTSVSIVNLAVFLFTTSDTRGRDTIKIAAASACFR